jgi:osmoprotectant transport system permease protein
MSEVGAGRALAEDPIRSPDPRDRGEEPAAATSADTATVAARMERLGLLAMPLFIALLSALLIWYYQSLDLANATRQQRSALDWSTKLVPQLKQHLQISAYSTLLVIIIAVPIGIALTRPALRRVGPPVLAIANAGQALPAYGLLVLGLLIAGQGQATVVYALTLYALLPVLRNTMVGLEAVDQNIIEAGRGMGMTKLGVLGRIELPLAVPIIVAGVRIAMVINIGMATLAFLIGGGGLGITISSGLKLNQDPVLIVGAVLVAIVALSFDWIGAVAERYLKPRGI